MRKLLITMACAGAILTLASCYPNRFDEVDDYETVLTLFNESADFGAYQTYALADDRGLIEIGDDVDVTHAYDASFFQRIRANMNERGYTEIDDPAAADLVILAGVTTTDYLVSSCYYWWDYYCWYYCYPGYGWCYPAYVATYTTGTVVAFMIDNANYVPGTNATLAWTFSVGSILAGNAADVVLKVDQAFAQSPYIQAD
jgi:hypothetical protein